MDNFLNELASEARSKPQPRPQPAPDLAERSLAMAREAGRQAHREGSRSPQHDPAMLVERIAGSPPIDPFSLDFYLDSLLKKLNRSASFVKNDPRSRGVQAAAIEVRINPDGSLKSFTVTRSGDQQAEIAFVKSVVERAVPFSAFPPDIVRSARSLGLMICIQPTGSGNGGFGFTRRPGSGGRPQPAGYWGHRLPARRPMPCILALDQGTSSSRAIVFDATGEALASAQLEFRQSYPEPGRVEHDPSRSGTPSSPAPARPSPGPAWRRRRRRHRHRQPARNHRAVGPQHRRPLAPAIVWQDRRTVAHCDALRAAGHAGLIRARSGLELDAYFSATKLAWLLDNIPTPAAGRGRRARLRHHRQLAGVAAHRRPPARHRPEQRLPHDALRHPPPVLGRRPAGAVRHSRAVLPEVVASSGVLGETDPALFGAPSPSAAGRRPAGRHLRPGLPARAWPRTPTAPAAS
jgi:hypothetical protein